MLFPFTSPPPQSTSFYFQRYATVIFLPHFSWETLSGARAHKVVLASASPFTNTLLHWVFPEDNARIWGPNKLQPNKLFYIEWQFLHARSQCTSHKLNGNYIWTVEWRLALILAPSGGVGVNYSGLGQSESSNTSEEFWGLDQWECSINAKKWARLLQQQWKWYCEWTKTILHTKGRIHKSSIASKVCCQCHSLK